MSLDQVDDIEAAEELIGRFVTATRMLVVDPTPDDELVGLLRDAIVYCRPTCGRHGAPHVDDHRREAWETDEDCGCPCHDQGFGPRRIT